MQREDLLKGKEAITVDETTVEEIAVYEEEITPLPVDATQFETEEEVPQLRDFSKNQVSLNFSWTLMNQVRQMAKMEGISPEDLLVELVAEGVTKRAFEDQSRSMPSHLMTRTGYMHSDGDQAGQQPQLSHHMQNNRQQGNQQNRNRFNQQQKNPSAQNHNNSNGRGYQRNNNQQQRYSRNNNNYNKR